MFRFPSRIVPCCRWELAEGIWMYSFFQLCFCISLSISLPWFLTPPGQKEGEEIITLVRKVFPYLIPPWAQWCPLWVWDVFKADSYCHLYLVGFCLFVCFWHSHHWKPPVLCSSLTGNNTLFSSSSLYSSLLPSLLHYLWLIAVAVWLSLQAALLGKTRLAPHFFHGKQSPIFCADKQQEQTPSSAFSLWLVGRQLGSPTLALEMFWVGVRHSLICPTTARDTVLLSGYSYQRLFTHSNTRSWHPVPPPRNGLESQRAKSVL